MSTDARRPDAPACGRETTPTVAPTTPVRARPCRFSVVARHHDAPRAVPSTPAGTAVPYLEVPITIVTTGVAR